MKINRLNDLFFKYLMGNDARKDMTLNFLNAILADGEQRFLDIEFVNKDIEPEAEKRKLSKLDICGTMDDGTQIDIEVQVCPYRHMAARSLYYWSRMYSGQLAEGEDYKVLKPAIAINLLAFTHLKDEAFWHNSYRILNTNDAHGTLTNHLEIHFLELNKLKISDVKAMKSGDCWAAYFSGRCSDRELEEIAMQEPMIQKAMHAENYFTGSKDYRYKYEQREKAVKDYISFYSDALDRGMEEGLEQGRAEGIAKGRVEGMEIGRKEGMEIGREEGRAKGREEGIAKGREEGIAKGREEGIAKGREDAIADLVRRLLEKSKPVSEIAEFSDWTEERICAFAKECGLSVRS